MSDEQVSKLQELPLSVALHAPQAVQIVDEENELHALFLHPPQKGDGQTADLGIHIQGVLHQQGVPGGQLLGHSPPVHPGHRRHFQLIRGALALAAVDGQGRPPLGGENLSHIVAGLGACVELVGVPLHNAELLHSASSVSSACRRCTWLLMS